MEAEPEAGTSSLCPSALLLGSEDSDEDTSYEEPPVTSWSELSIIERVGLDSAEMSEKDLEAAFSQITLAFRCDQYTLKQRLQAEEHARNLAEENIQLELSRGRETLETLKGLCLDSKRSTILQKLELSLDILAGTVERISNTAEVLGAVHQEARVSRAVELMVAHVENLRSRQERNLAELQEAKKAIQQQNPYRTSSDPRASPDAEDSDSRRNSSQQYSGRRRVSITFISKEKLKKDLKKRASHGGKKSVRSCPSPSQSSESSCSAQTKDDSCAVNDRPQDADETPSEAPAAQPPPQSTATPDPECLPPKQAPITKTPSRNSTLGTVHQRHKGKTCSSKKRADRDKKSADIYRRLSVGTYSSLWRQRPLAQWVYRCRWALLCTYLLVFLCVIALTYLMLEAS